jgi:hypothetical protein
MASSSWRACRKRKGVVYYSRSRLYIFWAYFGVAYIGQGLGFFGLENVYWFIDLVWFSLVVHLAGTGERVSGHDE